MSGRFEKEMLIDKKMKEELENMPNILTDYYYSLIGEGKSYKTAQEYIYRIKLFIQYIYKIKKNEKIMIIF